MTEKYSERPRSIKKALRNKSKGFLSGAGGIEVEPLQEETTEFDVFYFYLKELLDVVDEMEKNPRRDL